MSNDPMYQLGKIFNDEGMNTSLTRKAVELARLELNIGPGKELTNWDAWAAKAVQYIETLDEEEIDSLLVRYVVLKSKSDRRLNALREMNEKEESLISSALDKGLLNNYITNNNFKIDREIK